MYGKSKIRILLADDHGIMRDGLSALIKKNDEMEVVGAACTGSMAVEMAGQLKPDVVLMDIKMPGMDGIQASRIIKEQYPEVKILALSSEMAKYTLDQAIGAGIRGFVLKEYIFDELIFAINSVYNDREYFCQRVKSVLTNSYIDHLRSGYKSRSSDLTKREYEMIWLLSQGKSVGEIALYLDKSPKTIDARRRETMNKLGISSMAELTKFAIREGITTLD